MFSNGFRGVSLLLSKDSKREVSLEELESVQEKVFGTGLDLGIAFQIIDDILDFIQSSDLDKNSMNDLKEGILTAPVFFSLHELKSRKSQSTYNTVNQILRQKEYSIGDLQIRIGSFVANLALFPLHFL